MLERMRRRITGAETRALLSRIRQEVPGIHIRTTLMVGFPGETDEDFENLLDFVREQRFERMGAFAYCEEEDTYAAEHYNDDVPDSAKHLRLDRLMALQEEIALEHNRSKIGTVVRVLIESENGGFYIGRSQYDSPEVDPEVRGVLSAHGCTAAKPLLHSLTDILDENGVFHILMWNSLSLSATRMVVSPGSLNTAKGCPLLKLRAMSIGKTIPLHYTAKKFVWHGVGYFNIVHFAEIQFHTTSAFVYKP